MRLYGVGTGTSTSNVPQTECPWSAPHRLADASFVFLFVIQWRPSTFFVLSSDAELLPPDLHQSPLPTFTKMSQMKRPN